MLDENRIVLGELFQLLGENRIALSMSLKQHCNLRKIFTEGRRSLLNFHQAFGENLNLLIDFHVAFCEDRDVRHNLLQKAFYPFYPHLKRVNTLNIRCIHQFLLCEINFVRTKLVPSAAKMDNL